MTIIYSARMQATADKRLIASLNLHAGVAEADVEALAEHVQRHLDLNGGAKHGANVAARLADRVLDVGLSSPTDDLLHALQWLAEQLAWAMATAPEVAR